MEVEDAPTNFESSVWQHFGFPARNQDDGNKVVDRTKTICKLCRCVLTYTTANTSNMLHHLNRHHKEKIQSSPPPVKLTKGQTTLKKVFSPPLSASSQRAKEITRSIGIYIAKSMRPFSSVDEEGFRHLLNTLEPKYHMPSRLHFSKSIVPALYKEVKIKGESSP